MSNPSKAKGTRAETRVARYLSDRGLRTERKALAGSSDKGDLLMHLGDEEVTLEVKTGVQTSDYSRAQLNGWKEQTLVEGRNSNTTSFLIVVRYRRRLRDAEVWIPGHPGWVMLYLDEFADWALGYARVA